jgi:hypothetical protein
MELGENWTISRTSSLWMGHSFVWFFSIISVSFGQYSCPVGSLEKNCTIWRTMN